ncbi:hypothetical protein FRC96_10650 [Lujinxingia vulgaris]|uniref:Type II secretion system protein GspE N-terminal domain-containing protein n=2 Tax=Lujinxingia vulgaris TaxID=2600176 RepID=A0A5C6X1N8_9DELT|nr:hypothetical protein FRC96_10650 [Lujinxingia vulgaris]
MPMERQLVDHLVAQQVVSRQDIQRCVLRASMSKGSVVEELITRAGVDERQLARAIAEHLGLRVHERPSIQAQPEALALVSSERAEEFGVLAITYNEASGELEMVVFDADRARPVLQEVREATGISPSLVIAPRSTLEREIFRHYNHEHAADKTVAAPVQPPAMARARPPRHMPGDAHEPATRVVHLDDSGPTRQVDLHAAEDNPFFDLVKNARGEAGKPSLSESTSPGPQPGEDFFDGFEDAFTDALEEHQLGKESAPRKTPKPSMGASRSASDAGSSSRAGASRGGSTTPSPRRSASGHSARERDFGDMAGALNDFDAQLDASSDAYEQPSSSRLNASGFERRGRTGSQAHYSRTGSGLIPLDPSQSAAPGFDSGESGLFPIDRQPFGFLDNDETDGAENEPTLAQVVARQRQHITRLEREVEYQKAILQSLAEMLVEARVLSRRKLKARLKELREKESKR